MTAADARQAASLLRDLYAIERASAVGDKALVLALLEGVDPILVWELAATLDGEAQAGDVLALFPDNHTHSVRVP